MPGSAPPTLWGSRASVPAMRSASTAGSTPTRVRTGRAMPSAWSSTAASRWSGVTSGLLAARARSTAAEKASWVLRVQRSGLMLIVSLLLPGLFSGSAGWARASG